MKEFNDFLMKFSINDNKLKMEISLDDLVYLMEDVGEEREIIDIKTNEIVKYDWSKVKQLI